MGLFPVHRVKSASGSVDPIGMATWTLANLSTEGAWLLILGIALWMVLMCLKTLGHGYHTAVRWQNLKVEAHNLRLRHKRDLNEMKRAAVKKEAVKRKIDVAAIESEVQSEMAEPSPTDATDESADTESMAQAA